jgi:hypothetical protein
MKALVRRGLDALAHRIAVRLPAPQNFQQLPYIAPVAPAASVPLPQNASDQSSWVEYARQNQAAMTYQTKSFADRMLFLGGQIAAASLRTCGPINHLGEAEFKVSSQWGEDGIIEWLCLQLPNIPRSFVEFGVQNYSEANTRFLLQNRGWKGLILDGDEASMRQLREEELYWKYDLTAVGAFITAENINDLIYDHGFDGELGILSVDIDGNDYWVLKAITCVNPSIIIMEVNGVFGDLKAFTIPYRPDFTRFEGHYSGQYFGCSIKAARQICEDRGYTYLGTNIGGVNAFFVRNDLAGDVLQNLREVRTWAARHRDSRNRAAQLDFVRGIRRYDLIKDLPAVDIDSGKVTAIRDLGELYSPEFLRNFE